MTPQPLDVDLAALIRDATTASAMTNENLRRDAYARTQALATLDIAVSLRELAAYVNMIAPPQLALAEGPDEAATAAQPAPAAPEPADWAPPADLEIGDVVEPVDFDEDDDEWDFERVVTATGESEGVPWLVYAWDEGGERRESGKVWAKSYRRVAPAKPKRKGRDRG